MDTIEQSKVSTEEILSGINELKALIDSGAGVNISELLVRIHRDLYAKPECFGILTDEQISTLIKGIEVYTRKELVAGKSKPNIKKSFTMDDLTL